jgi:hypothetical protein
MLKNVKGADKVFRKRMTAALIKGIGIWLIILPAAVVNGLFREKVLTLFIGAALALPLSGIILSVFIFIIIFLLIPFIGESTSRAYLAIGLLWVALTLSFEYLFGYFVMGRSWHEINQVFNVKAGNLFIASVFTCAISPWVVAKIRGLI